MNEYAALIQEFIARKEQVLNLELRMFILLVFFQIVFLFFYVCSVERLRTNRSGALLTLSSILFIYFEILAINGKMGLVSIYLRQMEVYMSANGLPGAIWESRALDAIIFRPGNAFTLPAGIALLLLLAQSLYAVHFTVCACSGSKLKAKVLTVVVGCIFVLLSAKSLTVDFGKVLPTIF